MGQSIDLYIFVVALCGVPGCFRPHELSSNAFKVREWIFECLSAQASQTRICGKVVHKLVPRELVFIELWIENWWNLTFATSRSSRTVFCRHAGDDSKHFKPGAVGASKHSHAKKGPCCVVTLPQLICLADNGEAGHALKRK